MEALLHIYTVLIVEMVANQVGELPFESLCKP